MEGCVVFKDETERKIMKIKRIVWFVGRSIQVGVIAFVVILVYSSFYKSSSPVAEKNSPEPVVQETSQTTNVVKTRVQPTFSDVVN